MDGADADVEAASLWTNIPETGIVLEHIVAVELIAVSSTLLAGALFPHTNNEQQQDHQSILYLSRNSQRKPSRIRIRISRQSHLEHRLRQRSVEIEAVLQRFDHDVFGQVQAVAVKEAVVR